MDIALSLPCFVVLQDIFRPLTDAPGSASRGVLQEGLKPLTDIVLGVSCFVVLHGVARPLGDTHLDVSWCVLLQDVQAN